jgi:hypothetical protein
VDVRRPGPAAEGERTMKRRDEHGLGVDADGRRRRKVAGPEPRSGDDPREQARRLAGWPEQAGSRSGEFTITLVNQVCRALYMGEDPRLQAVQFEAAAAALEEIGPRDPIEGMLAGQIVAVHDAAMLSLHLASRNGVSHELRDRTLNQANKLVRSCAALVEALGRHRKPPEQVVRVELVTVEAGGQAIVGPVGHRGGGRGDGAGTDEQSHARAVAHAPEPALRGQDTRREPVPAGGGEGQEAVPDARRLRRGARGQPERGQARGADGRGDGAAS